MVENVKNHLFNIMRLNSIDNNKQSISLQSSKLLKVLH
jgi:hypothetical protein